VRHVKLLWQGGRYKVALLFFSLVASFLLAECLARLAIHAGMVEQPQEHLRVFVHEKSDNIKLLYKPVPNAENYFDYKSGVYILNKINSSGFRDREFSLEKPAGVTRITFLGDSLVYGYGLELEDTLPKQLENVFRANDKRVEVLNLGVSGYESEQEIEFLKEVGLKHKPDIVLVGYTLNDSNYASWELDLFDSLVHAEVEEREKSFYRHVLGFFYRHSKFLYLLDKKLRIQRKVKALRSFRTPIRRYVEERNKKNKDPIDSPYRQLEKQIVADAEDLATADYSLEFIMGTIGFWASDLHSSHWYISRRAFEELKKLSEQYDFKVVIVIFPIMQEMDKYPLRSLHEFLDREFQAMGFHVIDMMTFVKELYMRYGRRTISDDAVHFNVMSSPLVAEELYDQLSRINGLV